MKRDEKPKSDAATRAYVYPPPHMTCVLLLTQERRCNKTEQKSNGSATEEREAAREQTQPHFVRVLWQVWGGEFVCVCEREVRQVCVCARVAYTCIQKKIYLGHSRPGGGGEFKRGDGQHRRQNAGREVAQSDKEGGGKKESQYELQRPEYQNRQVCPRPKSVLSCEAA